MDCLFCSSNRHGTHFKAFSILSKMAMTNFQADCSHMKLRNTFWPDQCFFCDDRSSMWVMIQHSVVVFFIFFPNLYRVSCVTHYSLLDWDGNGLSWYSFACAIHLWSRTNVLFFLIAIFGSPFYVYMVCKEFAFGDVSLAPLPPMAILG